MSSGKGDGKGLEEGVDVEATDSPISTATDEKPNGGYGGFSDETYSELVRYHRDKDVPLRLQGLMKHRIDCFKRKAKRFQLIEGTDQLIYIGFKPEQGNVGQFVVRECDVERILAEAHLESNHGGLNATRKMVSSKFYWNSITNDVENFIKRCPRCRITRQRYLASNNVPWRKRPRYGSDYYPRIYEGSEDDYAGAMYRMSSFDRSYDKSWRLCEGSNGEEYVTAPRDIEVTDYILPKRVRTSGYLKDDISENDIDVENTSMGDREEKVDVERFLPHYFRSTTSKGATETTETMDGEVLNEEPFTYEEYGNADEDTYYEEELIGQSTKVNVMLPSGEEGVIIDRRNSKTEPARTLLRSRERRGGAKANALQQHPPKHYQEDGRDYVVNTDKKYFMVSSTQLLQLFKRCPDCGEKLKTITLSANSSTTMPVVVYECLRCESSVWFGQKVD